MSVVKKSYVYLVLVIFIVLCVFLICSNNSDKETKLETVKLKDEINEISKNSFAIMIEKEDGTGYEEVDEFPNGYAFNNELSGCIDIDGKTLENAISYSGGAVTVNVNSTAYCYLYFNYDAAPTSFTFYIGGSNNPEYVTTTNTTAYLSWSDTDISYYCVTNTQGSDNCIWQSTSDMSVTVNHTLTSEDGTKTVYAYIKDIYGSISPEMNDTIILDSSAPTSNSVSINSGAPATNSTSVTLTLSSSGASQMCISNTSSCSSWETYATSKSWTLTTGVGTKTVYVWYKDEYGNTTSSYVSDTIIFETTPPTIKYSVNGGTYNSTQTLTITPSDTGGSGFDYMMVHVYKDGTMISAKSTDKTTSSSYSVSLDSNGAWTIYSKVFDKAGNKHTQTPDNGSGWYYEGYIIDTVYPTVTASAVSNNTTSPKISITSSEAGTYCVNTSSTRTNFSNCTLTGSISANASLTTSALSSSGTYYVHVKDSAGNIGISSAVSIAVGNPFGTYLINNSISGLHQSYIGTDTLYRFSGISGNTGINNYICLGATSCASGDDNMYRIIGVEPSTGYVKVIKQTPYGSAVDWNSSEVATWSASTTFATVNTTWFGSISFSSMIKEHSWNVNVVSSNVATREAAYTAETGSTVDAYVGIISLSDFYMAYRSDQDWKYVSTQYSNNGYSNYISNWIHSVNNVTDGTEWTMTSNGSTHAWYIFTNGSYFPGSAGQKFTNGGVSYGRVVYSSYSEKNIRPTFYLKNTVLYKSGSGTSSDPFIVS